MSYREKLAWTSLVLTLLIWGWFAAKVLAIGFGDMWAVLGLAVRAVIAEIIVSVVIAVTLAVQAPDEADLTDERERAIALKAKAHGLFTLNAAVFGIATAPLWLPLPVAEAGVAMGVAALLAMALSELVTAGSAIIGFRRA